MIIYIGHEVYPWEGGTELDIFIEEVAQRLKLYPLGQNCDPQHDRLGFRCSDMKLLTKFKRSIKNSKKFKDVEYQIDVEGIV